jgi:hypothetical protein
MLLNIFVVEVELVKPFNMILRLPGTHYGSIHLLDAWAKRLGQGWP